MAEKLSSGPKAGYDLARIGSGLSRGPSLKKKAVAAAWSNTWPAPGATLDLDFANNRGFVRGVGQGGAMDAVTFTRASNGTFVGSNGLLQGSGGDRGAEGKNLLTFPQDFDNAAWVKTNASVSADVTTAPDGTRTADFFSQNGTATTTGRQVAFSVAGSTSNGQTLVYSVYLKAAQLSWALVYWLQRDAATVQSAYINLSNGSVGTTVGSPTVSVSDAGNGWYRCAMTVSSGTGASAPSFRVYLAASDGSVSLNNTNLDGIFIWGAQLELGSTATDYYPTNINAPRFDWASTAQVANKNLLTYTQEFDNAYWTKVASSVSANADTAPDGSLTADKIVEDSTTAVHLARSAAVGSAGTTYTVSVYIKPSGRNFAWVGVRSQNSAYFDLVNATTPTTGATAEAVGNGWVRCSFQSTFTAARELEIAPASTSSTNSYLGNGTSGVLVWGAQVESGSAVTTYVQVGSAVPTNTPLAANPTCNGLLIEESRTNRLLWCRDATQSNWTKTNITAAKDQTGIDGVSNAASSLTATAGNGTCVQTVTLASGARTSSVYLKRITGTGNVQVSLDGSTWSTVDLSSTEWRRIVLSGTVTNPVVGIRLATNGDAVAMDYGQIEDGPGASTPILTTTASATRAADSPAVFLNSADGRVFDFTKTLVYVEFDVTFRNGSANGNSVVSIGTNNNSVFGSPVALDGRDSVGFVIPRANSLIPQIGTPYKVAVSLFQGLESGMSQANPTAAINAVPYPFAQLWNIYSPPVDRLGIGFTQRNPSTGNQLNGRVRRVVFVRTTLPISALQAMTGGTT